VLSFFGAVCAVRLSLSEVEVTTRKAALGAGFPLGLAEEAGACAAWLAAAGFPFAELMAAALLTDTPERPHVIRKGDVVELAGEGVCSALRMLPSACDLVIASANARRPISVEARVDVPALAIAQAALASAGSAVPLAVAIGGVLSVVTRGENSPLLFGSIATIAALRSKLVSIRLMDESNPQPQHGPDAFGLEGARVLALEQGVVADDHDWERVSRLAARTLVPATIQSREHGAGAGLIDSD
jgi:hypothetical protein